MAKKRPPILDWMPFTPTVIVRDPKSTNKVLKSPGTPPPKDEGPPVDPAIAAQAAANAQARAQSQRQNEATRALADAQFRLLGSFTQQRDTKLGNIERNQKGSDANLLAGYSGAITSLNANFDDNDKAEGDASYANIANALRERGELIGQASAQGAGETDLLRAQLQALRNYDSNQGEVNRSFFDTLRSINNSLESLNTDVTTSRRNLFNQAESEREAAWANWAGQTADTWTQISNIENSNTNINSDSSTAYQRAYGQAADSAAAAVANSYTRKDAVGLDTWDGKGSRQDRELTSSNKAAAIQLGSPQKKPEGATLRKW